jgi:hypothetical protein
VPRYHFNVHDSSNIPDREGTDLPNLQSARVEAVKLAGQSLLDEAEAFWEGSNWHLEVMNDRGLILFRLDFMATEAAAASL